jgi:predicted Rossmann-fold nucleotide-binding protein
MSHAYVVVDGGIGTTLELMVVWQLLQVEQLEDVPLIAVGPMWSELVKWACRHMTAGPLQMASPPDMEIVRCVATTDEAVALIRSHRDAWRSRMG